MLSVNYKPVVSGPGMVSKIVLTDNAYSETSVVYMDKKDAPYQNTLVWVTIKDPGATGNMLERWMYVQHVLFPDFADVIQRDEEGDPILDGNGYPVKNSMRTRPGLVKVILREHKNTLTRSMFLDAFNLPSLLSYKLKEFSLIEKYNAYNEVNWEGIHELISHRGIKLLTAGDDQPPIIPVNMYWKGLYLADGLDDLLFHFSSRVIEQPEVTAPTKAYLAAMNHQSPPLLTNLVWKKRRFVDLDTSIIYDTIAWPEETNESRHTELTDNKIAFTTISLTDFERSSESPATSQSGFLRCNKVIAGGDRTIIRQWLNETYINRYLFYAFSTRRLPASFLEEKDWSKIEYIFTDSNYTIVVRHEPRPLNRLHQPFIDERKETFAGRVTSVSGSSITLKDLRNQSSPHRDLFLDGSYVLDMPSFAGYTNTLGLLVPDLVGKDINFQIANNVVTVLSTTSLYSELSDEVKIQPLHNGDDVIRIKHFIEYLSYSCPDSAISFNSDPIFDYEYDSHEVNPNAGSDYRINEWEVIDEAPNAFNLELVDELATCKVTFKLKATKAEIIDFIEATNTDASYPYGPEYIEGIADFWLTNFQYVTILFSFSPSATSLRWRSLSSQEFMGTAYASGYYDNIRHDIDSSLFTGLRGASLGSDQSFPLVFPDPGVRITSEANYFRIIGTPGWEYNVLVEQLAQRYIANHLETFTAQIQLVYA